MEFVKRHYEKILLSLVLLGLAGAAAWLPIAIKDARQDLDAAVGQPPNPKPLSPVDLTKEKAALDHLKNPPVVVLSGGHNLFNPVTWKRTSTNLIKILVEGPEALVVKDIRPLFTKITFERVAGSGYYIGLEVHSKKQPQIYAKINDKPKARDIFVVREAKGPPEDPTELVIELLETQEKVSITKAQPFQRIDGYAADLFYPPDNKTFPNRSVGDSRSDSVTLGGETYKMVAITNNAVRVSADSTTKQTTIIWTGAPNPK